MADHPKHRSGRIFLVLAFVVMGALPFVLTLAGRLDRNPLHGDMSRLDAALIEGEQRRLDGVKLPPAFPSPAEFSPFSGETIARVLMGEAARGKLLTNLGYADWEIERDDLLARVPERLRLEHRDVPTGAALPDPGLNYVQLDAESIRHGGVDALLQAIAERARIVGFLPDATLLLYVEPRNREALRAIAGVTRIRPLGAYNKIALDFGARPHINRNEADRPDILANVIVVPGLDSPDLRARLEATPGVSEVAPSAIVQGVYQLRVHYTALDRLARIDEILWIGPRYEWMLSNAENAPTVQVGSFEDSGGVRPFDDAGVDGGGIDTNGDGRRINNGTDDVPPQIVAVADNGISLDTPSFAQTATQTITITSPIGSAHRKVHSIQPIVDAGSGCDAQLSGSGTHGTVVASAIAAYPSQLGVFARHAGLGDASEPRAGNLDGVARGARILLQDIGDPDTCTINSLVERGGNVAPGPLAALMNLTICPKAGGVGPCLGVIGGATEVHLAVLPFGAPANFSTMRFLPTDGTYPVESFDLDSFLYNNRDFMIAVPVGNSGAELARRRLGLARPDIPDLFNGIVADDGPPPRLPQTSPPATAKNIISVGSSAADCSTFFGTADCEGAVNGFTSHGPATAVSLRMAPMVTAPGFDLIGAPLTSEVAAFRSRDNDNVAPIEAHLDEGNFGTSFAAAYVTGAAALVRDYFAQGFYPSGARTTADRVPNMSGALVKALLAASADFNEGGLAPVGAAGGESATDTQMRRTRAMDTAAFGGPGIIGNSEQGFGRVVVSDVLPLQNWPDDFMLHPSSGSPTEYPAAGLVAWDRIVSGEPLIDNAGVLAVSHVVRLASPRTAIFGPGVMVAAAGQLRIALAWPDLPSPPGLGGPLVNDLDLTVEGPGPDNCLAFGDLTPTGLPCPVVAAFDNVFYYGNNYDGGHSNAVTDQWSKPFGLGIAAAGDMNNPVEAVHLSSDPNGDGDPSDSPLHLGNWRITVDHGVGGAIPGLMTIPPGPDPDEDDNGNGRLDPLEDDNGNGLLDLPGQAYALAVAGPVFLAAPDPLIVSGPVSFPASMVSLDRQSYDCADPARVTIMDIAPGSSAAVSRASTTVTMVNAAGTVLDTESGIDFTLGTAPGTTMSAGIPIRLASPPIPQNGLLEGDSGQTIVVTYARAGAPRVVTARAPMRCEPDLINGFFVTADGGGVGSQAVLNGGCDDDEFLDAGETVSYGVALRNRSRTDSYHDVVATLTPAGPGAAALRVLDSPKNMGNLAGGGDNAVFFQVFVDPALANALPIPNRVVDLTLTLDAVDRGQMLSRQTYTFRHAINSDRQISRYSTDYPLGGVEIRDLNRNLVIDPAGTVDPFLGFIVPVEDALFATLVAGAVPPTNTLGEDLNGNGVFDGSEYDVIPNGVLDPGLLVAGSPWNFDAGPQGWNAFRHPGGTPAGLPAASLWEHQVFGPCGWQTMVPGAFGIWHTGDGLAATPPPAGPCDNHVQPAAVPTPPRTEMTFEVLESAIIAKVNQAPDARGFPYTVEFQRLAFNQNIQLLDGYAGGGVNIDNDIDNDSTNSLLGQHVDAYYLSVHGGWPFGVFRDTADTFDGPGIDPGTDAPRQRTFAPPGFAGPLPTAGPDQTPFPGPGLPPIGVCDSGPDENHLCFVAADCAFPGVCAPPFVLNNAAGAVRNFEASLIGYEGGFASLLDVDPVENAFNFIPGPAGNRWLIGFGFWAIESVGGATDYGKSIDDVVFEWNEHHPEDEGALMHAPACTRFNGPGLPAGGQCATLSVDRTSLGECDEAVEVTVRDAKCVSGAPLGGACLSDANCGGGNCTADDPAVQVQVVTDDDSVAVPYGDRVVRHPGSKVFNLPAVPGSPGLFRGRVLFSTTTNNLNHVYTAPGHNGPFAVYYSDPLCDGDRDGTAGEVSFTDLDADGFPDATDDCPFVFHAQFDPDGDGVGEQCDVCPGIADDQSDRDRDGIGDACDFDDIDFDGVDNAVDNCPDVYNPNQTPGVGGRGSACSALLDRDGDGVADRFDNCVRVANAGLADGDGDGIGDACDGDCFPAAKAPLASGVCSRSNNTVCVLAAACPATGHCGVTQSIVCTGAAGCPLGEACINIRADVCVLDGVLGGPLCASTDDDYDADDVVDGQDNCATMLNTAFAVGSTRRQFDADRDGRGDVCDPATSGDDDLDLIPDDIVAFRGTIDCPARPLPAIAVESVAYLDFTGDLDPFPDTEESGNMAVTVRNLGPTLTDATAILSTTDPDVACITQGTIHVGTIASGATTVVGAVVGPTGFTFTTSAALAYAGPPLPPPMVDLCMTIVANETQGPMAPVCFGLLADIDLPVGAIQVFTLGPDGVAPSPDDGTIAEGFDIDRNGDGFFTVNDTFMDAVAPGVYAGACSTDPAMLCDSDSDCPPPACTVPACVGPPPMVGVACARDSDCGDPPVCYRGAYVRGRPASAGGDVLSGVACGGFGTALGDPACTLADDPAFDWHLHCPAGGGLCPNAETGACAGGCSYDTPAGGNRAASPPNSLHMGAHFDPASGLAGDTTHLATIQAYQSAPVNLAIFPRPGDLKMSFFQMVRLMDDHGAGTGNAGQCVDCADVQVQIDENPDPGIDQWGAWEKLVPFENVYDHTPTAWSTFGPTYCVFTPGDTGSAPPSPRGAHETLCFPQGAWSHCGSPYGTSVTDVGDCDGPGFVDPGGTGVWVQSRFDLARFLGQRLRIRWVAESWAFAEGGASYYELGDAWSDTSEDDGWWLDNIAIIGTITTQIAPIADLAPPTAACPIGACVPAIGDHGTNPAAVATDEFGVLFGPGYVAVSGQTVRINAWASTLPGGCVNGTAEFEFSRNGIVVQRFSSQSFYIDAPEHTTDYLIRVRCSTDFACTSDPGLTITLPVLSGDGDEAILGERASPANFSRGVEYFKGTCTAGSIGAPCNVASECGAGGVCTVTATVVDDVTRLRAWAPGTATLDVHRGTVPSGPAPKGTLSGGFFDMQGVASPCLVSNFAGAPSGGGTAYTINLTNAVDPVPAVGGSVFYEVAKNAPAGTNLNTFGCANPAICANPGWCELGNAGAPCSADADCPGGYCAVNRCTAGVASSIGRGCTLDTHCGAGGVCGPTPAVLDPAVPTFCSTDLGVAELGGCSRHQVCTGGTNAGRLCLVTADCPGGSCPLPAASSLTTGRTCYLHTPVPGTAMGSTCPPRGHPKRLVKRVPALLCP